VDSDYSEKKLHQGHPKPTVAAFIALSRSRHAVISKLMTPSERYDTEKLISSHLERVTKEEGTRCATRPMMNEGISVTRTPAQAVELSGCRWLWTAVHNARVAHNRPQPHGKRHPPPPHPCVFLSPLENRPSPNPLRFPTAPQPRRRRASREAPPIRL